MKKIYLLLAAIVVSITSNAQLNLTKAANCPIPGTYHLDVYYDSTSAIPKTTGLNKNWNFSSLVTNTSSPNTFSYVTSASTPSASAFPGATLATNDGAGSYNYYTSTNTNMDWKGTADVSSKTTFSDPMTWMIWPFTYGSANSDAFSATQTFSTTNISISGIMDITGTGAGTVTLPGGIKYNNCLQITRSFVYDIGIPFSWTLTSTNYEYWTSGFRTPIITVSYTKIDDGNSVDNDYSIFVNSVAQVGIDENEMKKELFIVYPNPVKDKLNIILKDNAGAEKLELYDVTGNLILTDSNTNSLNASSLSEGIYILKLIHKGSTLQKQVIITN